MPFTAGQRWISETEPELGLGTVLRREQRTVTLLFHASGELRTYATASAPLRRVTYHAGDRVEHHEGWSIEVEHVEENNGLLVYVGEGRRLPETELCNYLRFSTPLERLRAGQTDEPRLFDLRYDALQHYARWRGSDLRGLQGPRVDLVRHQFYIAHEVASRHAPRVLLADEVGLGKTIEAGLILHQRLVTRRAERVLVLVPEALQHQWFIEMLRRFQLNFSLFDEERCLSMEATTQDNPFLAEQLVLCATEFLTDHPNRQKQAILAGWDILVVDEAHHLFWEPDDVSAEYAMVERLAACIPGVLLLTATPEQLGQAGHFARLRLLDPDRFPRLDTFLAEAGEYRALARVAEHLLNEAHLSPGDLDELRHCLGESDAVQALHDLHGPSAAAARQRLVQELLDRHGTGRVLFRNTRAAMRGFPVRRVEPVSLPLPPAYRDMPPSVWLERTYTTRHPDGEPWWTFDPRLPWLVDLLRQGDKILLICASRQTVVELEGALRERVGLPVAVFHEGMHLLARDRAAAWFAEPDGAVALLCSEIGSEGRNFQFAHRLVLFDLPFNPNLLEQRIGRLDRIGQRHEIRLHIPYLAGSPQERLFLWYHQGMNAFAEHARAAEAVYEQLGDHLRKAVLSGEGMTALLHETRECNSRLAEALERGRDRLLELHSYRPDVAVHLVERLQQADHDPLLEGFLERLFDHFGVQVEEHSEHAWVLRPGERMFTAAFPGLSDDGLTTTCNRSRALMREDMAFLTWDHPMVTGTLELLLGSEQGNASVAVWVGGEPPFVEVLLETVHVLEVVAPAALQADRFLPPVPIRVRLDATQTLIDDATLPPADLAMVLRTVPSAAVRDWIDPHRRLLQTLLALASRRTEAEADRCIREAVARMQQALQPELARLRRLSAINRNVRSDEIGFLHTQMLELEQHLQDARPRLDAVRVVVVPRSGA